MAFTSFGAPGEVKSLANSTVLDFNLCCASLRRGGVRAGLEEHLRLEELKVDMQALEDQNAELEDLSWFISCMVTGAPPGSAGCSGASRAQRPANGPWRHLLHRDCLRCSLCGRVHLQFLCHAALAFDDGRAVGRGAATAADTGAGRAAGSPYRHRSARRAIVGVRG